MLGYFFKPKCWVQLVGSFYLVILIFLPRCWVVFNTGLFFSDEAAETVLLLFYHYWNCPLHVNNWPVQLSYQIWLQKTMEDSPDCWVNHWYNPPHSPRTVLIQSEQKGRQNHSGPLHRAHSLFELLPSGRRYRALSTRMARHRNSFFPQAIHLMNTWH